MASIFQRAPPLNSLNRCLTHDTHTVHKLRLFSGSNDMLISWYPPDKKHMKMKTKRYELKTQRDNVNHKVKLSKAGESLSWQDLIGPEGIKGRQEGGSRKWTFCKNNNLTNIQFGRGGKYASEIWVRKSTQSYRKAIVLKCLEGFRFDLFSADFSLKLKNFFAMTAGHWWGDTLT